MEVLREEKAGVKFADLYCKYGMCDTTCYNLKAKYANVAIRRGQEAEISRSGNSGFKTDHGGVGLGCLYVHGIIEKNIQSSELNV